MFLFYIAVAFPAMVLHGRATSAQGTEAKLVRIAEHSSDVRLVIVLSLLACFSAPILAVALYGITRDEDHELSVLALCCRVAEGVIGATLMIASLGLLWLATAATHAGAPDAAAAQTLGAFLLKVDDWSPMICATFFAVGSTLFSWLLLRGRTIPVPLAWLGVIGSFLLVVALPLQLAGFLRGLITSLMWIPIAIFELTLGPWLLIKGAAQRN
jgi:hypothetical protein